jgi:hypothetical protein
MALRPNRPHGIMRLTSLCGTLLYDPAKVREFMDPKSLVFKWQNLCMSVWNIVDMRSVRIVSLTLICHCLARIGKVKCG